MPHHRRVAAVDRGRTKRLPGQNRHNCVSIFGANRFYQAVYRSRIAASLVALFFLMVIGLRSQRRQTRVHFIHPGKALRARLGSDLPLGDDACTKQKEWRWRHIHLPVDLNPFNADLIRLND